MPTELDRLRATLADRYDVQRELGRGGMATVYLARDLKHRRQVAIKVLSADLASTVGAERFLREIEVAARLHHPHILPLYDSGDAEGLLFYVMPQVEGESLRDRLNREKQLPVDDALQIAREVADALSYAHTHGVVHRDIKPENIHLESGHAVVADFGIAKAVSTATGDSLTATGLAVGTPAYMSPEQAAATGDIDGRSDLYSLGCVLYEMLTGKPPFVGPTTASIVSQHLTLDPTDVSALRPAVPGWVAAAVRRSLAKTPADRFNPVAQFAEALREPVSAGAAPPRAVPSATRRGAVVAVTIVVAAVAIWLGVRKGSTATPVVKSLAVLPLRNLSAAPSQEYLVEGIHEALIGELGRISGLDVRGRTSAMAFKGTTKTLPQIARELHVDALVEGSVFPAGDSVRVDVRLMALNPERQLWTESYTRDIRSVMAMMGDVTRTIAQEVRVRLTPQEASRLARVHSVNPEAQEHYLRARQLLYRRDREGILGSITELLAAIRADSAYAPAYATLASAYELALGYQYAPVDSYYAYDARALAAANRAIDLDSLLAEGYAARGYLGLYTGAPSDAAELDLRRAIALKPSYAEAYGWLAQLIAPQGRLREALAAVDQAIALDPLAPGMRVARVSTAVQSDSAELLLDAARQALSLFPRLEYFLASYEAVALLLLGRPSECVSVSGAIASIKAMCLHSLGRRREAESQIRTAIAAWNANTGDWFFLPSYYAWSGRPDETLEWYRRLLARTPLAFKVSEQHWMWRGLRDVDGGRTWAAVRQLHRDSWERIERESRTVKLP